jgi:hypothetical protein
VTSFVRDRAVEGRLDRKASGHPERRYQLHLVMTKHAGQLWIVTARRRRHRGVVPGARPQANVLGPGVNRV